jgi:hypothetical protein
MGRMTEKLTARWQHGANVLLGVWLAVSPWALAFADQSAAALNASVIGLLITLVAGSALLANREPRAHGGGERGLGRVAPWLTQEWITAEVGAWLIVSPYFLGFDTMQGASWTHFSVGALVVVLTLWAVISAQYADRPTTRGKLRACRRSARLAPKERHIGSSHVVRVVPSPHLPQYPSRSFSSALPPVLHRRPKARNGSGWPRGQKISARTTATCARAHPYVSPQLGSIRGCAADTSLTNDQQMACDFSRSEKAGDE